MAYLILKDSTFLNVKLFGKRTLKSFQIQCWSHASQSAANFKNVQACEFFKGVSLISKPTQAESAWFHVVGILWKRDDAVLRVSDERDASGGQMSVLAFKLYRTTVFWETWTDLREVLGQRVAVIPGLLLLVFRTCFFCVFNFFLWTFLLWWGFRPLYIHCLFDFCDGHQCFVTILLCCLSNCIPYFITFALIWQ